MLLIDKHLSNFRALRETIQKPEVQVDYRDLEYDHKLEFLDEDQEQNINYIIRMKPNWFSLDPASLSDALC